MKRIDSQGSQGGQWVGGSPFAGIPGTIIAADWMNLLQEEVCGLIEAAGFSLSGADATQLRQAIAAMIAGAAGAEITFTAGAALTAGQGFASGDVFGVIKASVAMGETATVIVLGTFTLPKNPPDNVAQFARLYWDAGNSRLTTTAGGNRSAGVATAAAGVGVTSVSVRLSGPPNV